MTDICVPNMKFVCLTLWLGEVYIDANDDANTDAEDAGYQCMTDKA